MKFINSANKAQFKFARSLTAHYAKSFYLSAAFLPPEKRWATYALYGFCRYVDNLIDTPRDRTAQETGRELDYIVEEIRDRLSYRGVPTPHHRSFFNRGQALFDTAGPASGFNRRRTHGYA